MTTPWRARAAGGARHTGRITTGSATAAWRRPPTRSAPNTLKRALGRRERATITRRRWRSCLRTARTTKGRSTGVMASFGSSSTLSYCGKKPAKTCTIRTSCARHSSTGSTSAVPTWSIPPTSATATIDAAPTRRPSTRAWPAFMISAKRNGSIIISKPTVNGSAKAPRPGQAGALGGIWLGIPVVRPGNQAGADR